MEDVNVVKMKVGGCVDINAYTKSLEILLKQQKVTKAYFWVFTMDQFRAV